jgi:hypothetical protein
MIRSVPKDALAAAFVDCRTRSGPVTLRLTNENRLAALHDAITHGVILLTMTGHPQVERRRESGTEPQGTSGLAIAGGFVDM